MSKMYISFYFFITYFLISGSPMDASNLIDMKFKDHEGKIASFERWKGSYVLLSFVYAGCPMPEMCPLTMNINKKIYSTWLQKNKPFPLHFAVATLDPEEDGPEEMKKYGVENGVSFVDFTMLTGSKNEMADLSSYFNSAPIPGEKLLNHKVVSVLLGPDLETVKIFTGNKYSYDVIQKLVFNHNKKSNRSQVTRGIDTTPQQEAGRFDNNLPEASLSTPEIINLSKREPLMGIDPKLYDKFWEQWPLVNVRFRSSPTEQRFVFANDVAWKALQTGSNSFPDGSVFGKVAFSVGFDPRFPSSYEPSRFSRVQLMKKDSTAYKTTDGWGYALYLPESPGQKQAFGSGEAEACHACHKLASNHDFVFDNLVFKNRTRTFSGGHRFEDNFKKTPIGQLNEGMRTILAEYKMANFKGIFTYITSGFQGTISESMLPIARLSSEKSEPYLLLTDHDGFILGYKAEIPNAKCKKSAKLIVRDISPFEGTHMTESQPIRELIFCDGTLK